MINIYELARSINNHTRMHLTNPKKQPEIQKRENKKIVGYG